MIYILMTIKLEFAKKSDQQNFPSYNLGNIILNEEVIIGEVNYMQDVSLRIVIA